MRNYTIDDAKKDYELASAALVQEEVTHICTEIEAAAIAGHCSVIARPKLPTKSMNETVRKSFLAQGYYVGPIDYSPRDGSRMHISWE